MSEKFIKAFTDFEAENFQQFSEYTGTIVIDAFAEAIKGRIKEGLRDSDEVELELPHGTYRGAVRESNGTSNINVSFEFSKAFMDFMKGKSSNMSKSDEIDAEFASIFSTLCAGKHYDPESDDGKRFKEAFGTKKGIFVKGDEVVYFINDIATLIADLAKKNVKEGKEYKIEIDNHGEFLFELDADGHPIPRFTADKTLKQIVKVA